MCIGGKRAGLLAVGLGSRCVAALFPNPVRTPCCSRPPIPSFSGCLTPRKRPNSKGREVGPRFSEFPGRPFSVEVPVCSSEGGKARILGISSKPNLKAQVSKLGQNRERLHSGWQAFSQVHDAFGRTVTQELGRLSQVLYPQGVETHQAGR